MITCISYTFIILGIIILIYSAYLDSSIFIFIIFAVSLIGIGFELDKSIAIEQNDSNLVITKFYSLPANIRTQISNISPKKEIVSKYNVYPISSILSANISEEDIYSAT